MSTCANKSSEIVAKSSDRSRHLLARINIRFPWLKLVAVIVVGVFAILDLLDLTISRTANLSDNFPTTPMSKHVKATERILKGKKLVALTFDDGPFPDTTSRLLDILTEKDAVATFFMLGVMARNYPDIAKRIHREGNEVASHTMYHQNLINIPKDAVASDLNESRAVFEGIFGFSPSLIRPPYGNINNTVQSLANAPLILWSVDPLDWQSKDPNSILEITLSQVKDGAIILMHDTYPTSVEATALVIDRLRADGYEFATISELVEARGVTLSPGNRYYNFTP